MRRKSKLQRLDAYVEDDVKAQIKEAAKMKGMSVSDFLGWAGNLQARDLIQERAANARIAAQHKESGEALEEASWHLPALAPMPTKPTPEQVQKNPGRAMGLAEAEAEYAAVTKAHRERLQRIAQCTHKGVETGATCPRCLQVSTRGSQGRIVTERRFQFHIPTRNGLGQP
jgi:uncharacterized protein (DUF1778 family)